MEKERYNHLNEYLKNKFGERTLKICIDGNFTCPNRDGKISKGGCIFCSETGSGEHIKRFIETTSSTTEFPKNISSIDLSIKYIQFQVHNYFNSYKANRANKFIAYFQNFTNTYDSIEDLERKYNAALCDDRIVALAIATRPDCIDEEICKLISSYKNKYYVWVELGLQTSNDTTAKIINRGYTSAEFSKAVKMLNKHNIDVVTHIMVGLPGESLNEISDTIHFLNNHKIQGLKIHSTYIVKNTKLEELYKNKIYSPISLEEYISAACYILTHINPKLIIHKLSGDAPKELLVAPSWNSHKKWILNGIKKYMNENDLYQGMFF